MNDGGKHGSRSTRAHSRVHPVAANRSQPWTMWISGWAKASSWRSSAVRAMAKAHCLNLITGLLKPTSGSIDLDGNDVTRLNDKQMSVVRNRIVGFVTQSQTLLPNLTALDNVILPSVLCNGKTAQRDVEIPADSSDAKSVEETVSDASSEQTVDDGLPDVIAAAPVSKTHNDPVQDHAMERAHALLRRLQVDDLAECYRRSLPRAAK